MSQLETAAAIIAGVAKTGRTINILVTGGRKYANRDKVFRTLDFLVGCDEENQLGHHCVVIHGACGVTKGKENWHKMKGADRFADDWAVCNWKKVIRYPADWDRYGNAAGFIRNTKMLVEEKPDYVVAFPGGRGTAHMVEISKAAGIPVIEVAE